MRVVVVVNYRGHPPAFAEASIDDDEEASGKGETQMAEEQRL